MLGEVQKTSFCEVRRLVRGAAVNGVFGGSRPSLAARWHPLSRMGGEGDQPMNAHNA